MFGLSDKIGDAAYRICMGAINTGVAIKRVALTAGELGSRVIHSIYSLDGFEKWSKALIADLRFLSLIPSLKGVFDECLKTIEAQKDLYYATLFIGSMNECIKVDKITGKRSFQLPKNDKGEVDAVKILYFFGNFSETGKFLQKYKVFSFELCTQVADRLASMKVFSFRDKSVNFGDIPVLKTLCEKPKDFFIFFASGVEVWRCLHKPVNWENAFKFAGSTGKMGLIFFGDILIKKKYFWSAAILDVLTQNASLLGYVVKTEKLRAQRFKNPVAAAVA